jgi:hypothetical protein
MAAECENDGATLPAKVGATVTRRDFLVGLHRWSGAVVACVAACAETGGAKAEATWIIGSGGGSWVNRRGGWINGGGSWVNRSGGWINGGGGGGGWVNRRGGGGAWVNR